MTPGSDVADAEAAVERARARMASSATRLKEELMHRRDRRAWVGQEPIAIVLGALALGFVVGWSRSRES